MIWKVKKRAGKVSDSLKLLTFSVLCRYENKYVKFFKSKPELPPGLSPDATAPVTPSRPEGGEPGLSKTAKRNLKRKEKRRQLQEKGEAEALSRTLEKVSLGETAQLPSAPQGSRGRFVFLRIEANSKAFYI